MPVLLVIDDDPLVLKSLELALTDDDLTVVAASSATAGLAKFAASRPDAVLCDVRLPDLSGLDLLGRLKESDPAVPVVLMTGHGTAETAIEAMRRGAFDYVLKPPDLDLLSVVVRKAFEAGRLMRVPAVVSSADEPESNDSGDRFVGQSSAMQEVFKAIGRVAPTDATVLILGESGTGKEMVARAVYHYSGRAGKPFLALNCAAVPDTLLESELFGHEKGAFTGAVQRRIGRFEQCHGGTLFLDEIGDMSLLTQSKILRLLQDQRFERVGGTETIQTDVRLIAATHRDLEAMIADGTFREDLYYRLNVCPIRLPPLRERVEDIPILVRHFLKRFAHEFGGPPRTVTPEAMAALTAYSWPGNVRQLQSVLTQAMLQAGGPVLTLDGLPPAVTAEGDGAVRQTGDAIEGLAEAAVSRYIRERLMAGSADVHPEVVGWVERLLLVETLRYTDGNLSRAAAVLGIARPTLRAKMAALGVEVQSRHAVTANPKTGHTTPLIG